MRVGQTDGRSSPSDTETEGATPESASESRVETPPAEPRAAANTLLSGASLQSTWRMPGLSDNPSLPADTSATGSDASGIHSLPATDDKTDKAAPKADGRVAVIAPPNAVRDVVSPLADTQELNKRVDPPRRAITNRKLGRTLRMELGISPAKAPPSAASDARAKVRNERLVPGATQRIGTNFDTSSSKERQPARSTDPFGRAHAGSARPAPGGPPNLPPRPPAAGPSWQGAIGGPAPTQRPAAPAWAARSLAPPPSSKRPARVGDKTIVTRRRSTSRDWLFIGLIV
ncbi:MAG TPA: hypothetical protein VHZ95_21905, partial [Polyangiales bacterium]|nr:hypothetical protein [Polyangiales bacterium]